MEEAAAKVSRVLSFGSLVGIALIGAFVASAPAALRLGNIPDASGAWPALAALEIAPLMIAITIFRRTRGGLRSLTGARTPEVSLAAAVWLLACVLLLSLIGAVLRAERRTIISSRALRTRSRRRFSAWRSFQRARVSSKLRSRGCRAARRRSCSSRSCSREHVWRSSCSVWCMHCRHRPSCRRPHRQPSSISRRSRSRRSSRRNPKSEPVVRLRWSVRRPRWRYLPSEFTTFQRCYRFLSDHAPIFSAAADFMTRR